LEKYLYLFSQIGIFFLLTFVVIKLFKQQLFDLVSLIISICITFLFFCCLEYYFTLLLVIKYNEANLAGLFIVKLPIEKILSVINLQLLGCLIYLQLKSKIENYKFRKLASICNVLSLSILVLLAIKFITKSYSFYFFFLASIYQSIVIIKKGSFMRNFYLTIFSMAIPVLILELLPARFEILELMNSETSGNLIFDLIPLESFFIDYFILLMTISLYEYFRKRKELNRKEL
jgi:hypothetical protein